MRFSIFLFLLCCQACSGGTPALDAQKYPQDAAPAALKSIIKALEARDFGYWLAHMIVPQDTRRQVEKHGSLEKAALASADAALAPRFQEQCELMKKMLETNKTTSGAGDGVKWLRFHVHEGKMILQLEEQPDGRWCMNTRIGGE